MPVGLVMQDSQVSALTCSSTPIARGDQPGEFVYLALPPCDLNVCKSNSGADAFGCQIARGYGCTPLVGSQVRIRSGGDTGQVRDGWALRFQADTDRRDHVCNADYHGDGFRIVAMPIVMPPVGDMTTVTGFAEVLVRSMPTGDGLELEFLDFVVFGSGGGP